MGFTAGLVLKNPPLMQKAPVWSLSWKDPLEKAVAIYSIIVALKIPLTEEPCDLQSMRYGELQSICCYWCSFLFLLFTFGFVSLFTFFSFFFFFFLSVCLFSAQHSLYNLGSLARGWAWASEVGVFSPGCWITREFPASRNINQHEIYQGFSSWHQDLPTPNWLQAPVIDASCEGADNTETQQ